MRWSTLQVSLALEPGLLLSGGQPSAPCPGTCLDSLTEGENRRRGS